MHPVTYLRQRKKPYFLLQTKEWHCDEVIIIELSKPKMVFSDNFAIITKKCLLAIEDKFFGDDSGNFVESWKSPFIQQVNGKVER